MEKVNVFNQMAQYDFSTPMSITTIFEENSNEGISNMHVLTEQVQNNNNNESTQEVIQVEEHTRESNDITKNKSSNRLLNESMLVQSLKLNSKQRREQLSNTKENTEVCSLTSMTEVAHVNTEGAEMSLDNNFPEINDHVELSTSVKNLLDAVSDHLLFIIRYYYTYNHSKNKNIQTDADFLKRFHEIKYYFFNLCYSTVVSLILPQEKNEKFVSKLIDNTVVHANKIFKWKCERQHVEPFYLQMMAWVKEKKNTMMTLGLSRPSNHTSIRKDITEPTQQLNMPSSSPKTTYPMNDAINNHEDISNIDENMCIFTSGASGKGINIHISPNTLMDYYQNRQSYCTTQVTKKKKINRRNSPQVIEQTPIQVNNVVSADQAHQDCCSPNITIHHKPLPTQQQQQPPPPPPYYSDQHHYMLTNILTNNSYNINQIQMKNSRMMQNIQTPAAAYHTPRAQQYYAPYQGQTLSPIITNVTSWHPGILQTTGRCCVCGKTTTSRCSKCNNFSYCSALCQELDAGQHTAICC